MRTLEMYRAPFQAVRAMSPLSERIPGARRRSASVLGVFLPVLGALICLGVLMVVLDRLLCAGPEAHQDSLRGARGEG